MNSSMEIFDIMHDYGEKLNMENNSALFPVVSSSGEIPSDGKAIIIDDSGYHYIIVERNSVIKKYAEKTITGILYYVFNDITFQLASNYELNHRNVKEDFRKILFDKQLEYLGKISISYQNKRQKELEQILEKAPFQEC